MTQPPPSGEIHTELGNLNEPTTQTVKVCQNRTCRRDGSRQVLAAFQAHPLPAVNVTGCGCLGQCGNGPMVLIEPELVWYWRMHPQAVPLIIEHHLRQKQPVQRLLYPKFRTGSNNLKGH